jgi:hypothetical protein
MSRLHPRPLTACWLCRLISSLAQKNLTIVDLLPNTFMILPIVIANWRRESDPMFDLEVWKPRTAAGVNLSLIHRSKEFFRFAKAEVKRFKPEFTKPTLPPEQIRLDCGGYIPGPPSVDKGRIMSSETADLVLRRFPGRGDPAVHTEGSWAESSP